MRDLFAFDLSAASERPWVAQKAAGDLDTWHIDKKVYAALNCGLIACVWPTGTKTGDAQAAADARLMVAGVALLDDVIALVQSGASDAEIGSELRAILGKEFAR